MRNLGVLRWIAGIAIVAAIVWYLGSPMWAMGKLREAAMSGDSAQLNAVIDFPELRSSIKRSFRSQPTANGGGQSPAAVIGDLVAKGTIDPLIDGLVTPGAIRTLVAVGKLTQGDGRSNSTASKSSDWSIDRKGLNRFEATWDGGGGEPGPTLVFARHGLGWKLSGIRLAPSRE